MAATGKRSEDVSSSSVFPTLEDFENAEYGEIVKWTCLPIDQVFRILAITEITCRGGFGTGGATPRVSRVAKLEDVNEIVTSVWLPGTVDRRLLTFSKDEVDSGCLYIRPLGPKVSKTTGNTYQNFKIIKS